MTGRCTRWQRWLPGSGGGLKVLNWNLHSFRLLELWTQYPGSVVPLTMFFLYCGGQEVDFSAL